MKNLLIVASIIMLFTSCAENYSNGERIGMITQFSNKGLIWKSWEGHLNVTQTGMNSSTGFDFSIDNDINNQKVINTIDSAANLGWKVKLIYHQVSWPYNFCSNRGETNFFINDVVVLDRNTSNPFQNPKNSPSTKDTVYVIMIKSVEELKELLKSK